MEGSHCNTSAVNQSTNNLLRRHAVGPTAVLGIEELQVLLLPVDLLCRWVDLVKGVAMALSVTFMDFLPVDC
jgi:hypothetical protein